VIAASGTAGLASVGSAPKLVGVSHDDRDLDENAPTPRDSKSPSAMNSADPTRNFSLTVDERIRALTIGVPAWAARKRKIEDDEERIVADLVELHDKLAARAQSRERIEAALLAEAALFNLTKLNDLVRTHNRYYPIEANLAIDQQTGSYLVYGRIWKPEETYTAARLVSLVFGEVRRRRNAPAE
jgi:hypothetical protein